MAGVTPLNLVPITSIQSLSGNQPNMRRLAEKATQTFQLGAAVQIDATGFVIESPAVAADTAKIAGFATEPAHNLTTSGVGTPGGITTGQKVPNQPAAVVIAIGGPLIDGMVGTDIAVDDTMFLGALDNAHVLAQTDVTSKVGLTKDTTGPGGSGTPTGIWFLDSTAGVGSGQVAEIVELYDPIGTTNGGRVIFKVDKANQQLSA